MRTSFILAVYICWVSGSTGGSGSLLSYIVTSFFFFNFYFLILLQKYSVKISADICHNGSCWDCEGKNVSALVAKVCIDNLVNGEVAEGQ